MTTLAYVKNKIGLMNVYGTR